MQKVVDALKALGDETRLRILNLILQRECCVCEVMQALGISQTRASRNLTMLYEAGFLKMRKQSLWVYYSLNSELSPAYMSSLIKAVSEALAAHKESINDLARLEKSVRVVCCLREKPETTNE